MKFSSRIHGELAPSDFSRAVEMRRASTRPLLDLTISNPTRAGFQYPDEEIRAALAEVAGVTYEPDPRGLKVARAAVSEYYRDRGRTVSPDSIVLVSGTSEAYAFLFKLLCDPGEGILFPEPSYPLIELIAELEGAAARAYPLAGKNWRWNVDSIFERLTPDVRAVVAVSPNNPTGSMLTAGELREVSGFCASHGLALIADEVFLDYPAPDRADEIVSSAGNPEALTFTLGGLSKACGLPQMKLAWIAVGGPEKETRRALSRLEFIADAFLSVGTPVQQSAPALLALGARVREQIRRRVDQNETVLREIFAGVLEITPRPRDGGWYAVIGLPPGTDDEEFALRVLQERGVLIQPGYFFDFDEPAIVLSLLTPEEEFRDGAEKIRRGLLPPTEINRAG